MTVLESGARLRDRPVAGCASSSNLDDPAHVVQAADDGWMHAFVFHKVTHRVIAGHGQAVLLAVEAVDKVEPVGVWVISKPAATCA